MVRQPDFGSEAELCAHFISHIGDKWTAYAETEGWDILLVRKADGFQIGVQAKMRLNAEVLNQTIDDGWIVFRPIGPDCRAVLVPAGKCGSLGKVAEYLGVTVLTCWRDLRGVRSHQFSPYLPEEGSSYYKQEWFEWWPDQRHPLPEYIPDVAAGSKAPIQLTRWKIGAIKIAVLVEERGFVTREDFKHIGIDPRRWLPPSGWMTAQDGKFAPGAAWPDFRAQHPRVFEEIKADFEKWAPKPTDLLADARP